MKKRLLKAQPLPPETLREYWTRLQAKKPKNTPAAKLTAIILDFSEEIARNGLNWQGIIRDTRNMIRQRAYNSRLQKAYDHLMANLPNIDLSACIDIKACRRAIVANARECARLTRKANRVKKRRKSKA